jgi:hypothetical protein
MPKRLPDLEMCKKLHGSDGSFVRALEEAHARMDAIEARLPPEKRWASIGDDETFDIENDATEDLPRNE